MIKKTTYHYEDDPEVLENLYAPSSLKKLGVTKENNPYESKMLDTNLKR
jgi:hypothetical protein